MFQDYPFSVRYGLIDPNLIVNYCGPKSQQYIDKLNRESGFYERLEQSILRDGFRNPILVTSGHQGCPNIKVDRVPAELRRDLEKILICDRNGGSRLWVAQRHNIPVPCLISDFVGRFRDLEELNTIEEVESKYADRARKIVANEHGIHIYDLPMAHLK